MPNLQSLAVTDRAGTPVTYILLPVKEEGGTGTVALTDASGAVITEKRFSIGQRRSGSRIRSVLRLRVPTIVTEVINGVSSSAVAREAYVDCVFNFADNSTEQERNDIVGMFASALAPNKPLVHDCVVKGQAVW